MGTKLGSLLKGDSESMGSDDEARGPAPDGRPSGTMAAPGGDDQTRKEPKRGLAKWREEQIEPTARSPESQGVRLRAFRAGRKLGGVTVVILKGYLAPRSSGEKWKPITMRAMIDSGAEADFISPPALERTGAKAEEGRFGTVIEAFGKESPITRRTRDVTVVLPGQLTGTQTAAEARYKGELLVAPRELSTEYDLILGQPFLNAHKALWQFGDRRWLQVLNEDGAQISLRPNDDEEPDGSEDILSRAVGRQGALRTRVEVSALIASLAHDHRCDGMQAVIEDAEAEKTRRMETHKQRISLAERAAVEQPDLVMSLEEWETMARDGGSAEITVLWQRAQRLQPTKVASVGVAPGELGPGVASEDEIPSAPQLGELPVGERAEGEKRKACVVADFKDVFPDDLPHIDQISPAVNGGVQIKTIEGARPAGRYGPRMTPADTEKARVMIDKLLSLGFIRTSDSDWGAPMFLVDKPDGDKRMVIDYRALNSTTIRNRYPLPRVDELFDLLSGARYFSKIDLRTGYWQIRMAPESVAKTAFTSRHGHFEWLVLPMGLTNAPAEFMKMMEDTFRDQLNKSILVFLDDILVFSKTLEEHEKHLRAALEKLRAKKLYGKLSKCSFFRSEVEFLGHHVGRSGVRMVEDKVTAVERWPTPRTQKEVERFIGLAGFYRKFIKHFSRISAPLTELCGTRKKLAGAKGRAPPSKPFKWEAEQQRAFDDLKRAVISAPCLALPDMEREFILHTDASGYATGAVLMQRFDEGLRPIAFLSKKMRAAERRYPVHEQELLAILSALKAWRHYLSGRRFTVWTDHQSLQYMESSQMATPRQMRWAAWLSEFDFSVRYAPGDKNVVADALSRAEQDEEEEEQEEEGGPQLLLSALADAGPLPVRIREAARGDPSYQSLLQLPRAQLARKKLEREGDLLYRSTGQFYVPQSAELRTWIMSWAHDVTSSAHRGSSRMGAWIKERAWWPKIDDDVQRYCRSCEQCQRSKPNLQGRQGLPMSIETPRAVGDWLSMDFVGPFPNGGSGATAVMVVVERLSRYVFFVPCGTTSSAQDIWKLLSAQVLTHTGTPRVIVSDRDTRFTSHFWEGLWDQMGTELKRSTAFHPQTDGQAERAVRTLVESLRTMIDATHENWEELLPEVARAFNSSKCESTGKTPDEMFFGGRRRTLLDAELERGGVKPPARHPSAQQATDRVRKAVREAHAIIEKAQKKQRDDAARGRRAVDIQVGDEVWLSKENLRPVGMDADRARKLDPIYCGPFKVARMAGSNAAELVLPAGWKLHPVFNLDKLKKHVAGQDLFPARPRGDDRRGPHIEEKMEEDPRAGGPASVQADDHFEVESIVGERGHGARRKFLVKWAGWPIEQASWVAEQDCASAQDCIDDYHRRVARQAPRRRGGRRALALLVDWARTESGELYLCGAAARRVDPTFKPGTGAGQPAPNSAEAKRREEQWKNTMWNKVADPNAVRPAPNATGEVDMGAQRCTADTKVGGWCKARTRYGCLCWVHRAQLNGTQIKDSTLAGAGKGLFARWNFNKGDAIVRYTGDVVQTADGAQEDGWRGSSYVLEVTNSWGIDAARTNTADGRLINDTVEFNKSANVVFAFDARRKIVTIRALKVIKAGEELFIKYGAQYWAREAVAGQGPARRQEPAKERAPQQPAGSRDQPIVLDSIARRVFHLGMLTRGYSRATQGVPSARATRGLLQTHYLRVLRADSSPASGDDVRAGALVLVQGGTRGPVQTLLGRPLRGASNGAECVLRPGSRTGARRRGSERAGGKAGRSAVTKTAGIRAINASRLVGAARICNCLAC